MSNTFVKFWVTEEFSKNRINAFYQENFEDRSIIRSGVH